MRWDNNRLLMLDQRLLPNQTVWIELHRWEEVGTAIRDMAVRGAPAIGIAAAYGMALAALNEVDLATAHHGLASSRPTAVNLFWALDRIRALTDQRFETVLKEAQAIEREDIEANLAIGDHGAGLLEPGSRILTICNTGALATAGHGTALGVIRTAHLAGKIEHVYLCETRPRQQGLKLTAYELLYEGIPFQSIADSAAAMLMKDGKVTAAITGADRIAANGDSANKIGTYMLAVCARAHGLPFYVAAPSSTIDASMPDGSTIPIEERSATELTHAGDVMVAPMGCPVYNPGFDVTPSALITGIITETGVHAPPYDFSKAGS